MRRVEGVVHAQEREKKRESVRAGKITHFDGIKMSVFPFPICKDSTPPKLNSYPPPPLSCCFLTQRCASISLHLAYETLYTISGVELFWTNSRKHFESGSRVPNLIDPNSVEIYSVKKFTLEKKRKL